MADSATKTSNPAPSKRVDASGEVHPSFNEKVSDVEAPPAENNQTAGLETNESSSAKVGHEQKKHHASHPSARQIQDEAFAKRCKRFACVSIVTAVIGIGLAAIFLNDAK